MSIMTKGLGTSANGGGMIITKGLQSAAFILPEDVPGLERAAIPGTPDIVKSHTPTSVYLMSWLNLGFLYG